MKRRSRAGSVKSRRRKAVTPKQPSRTARPRSSSAGSQESEIARLVRERNETAEQLAAASDVLKTISSSLGDLKPVFTTILENATRICAANFGVLHLYESGGFRIGATHNAPSAFADAVARRDPIFRPSAAHPLARVAATKHIVHVFDLSIDEAYKQRDPGAVRLVELASARSLIAVPMLNKDGKLIGDVVIYRQEVRPFTKSHIELVQNFAAQAVIAIENARLLNELRQSLEQQTATSEVLRVISSSPSDLAPVFQTMLASARRLCDATFGTLLLCEGNWRFRVVAMSNVPPGLAELRQREPVFETSPQTALGRTAATRDVVHIVDLADEAIYKERHHPAAVALRELGGARTFLGVPMLKDTEVAGAIVIYRQQVRPFTEEQIALVQNFAAQAVIAIENARLLNELRQRTDDLSEALEQQTATSEVLQVISSSPGELEPVFQAMLENATRICEAKFGSLFEFADGAFRALSNLNTPPALVDFNRKLRVWGPDTALGRLAHTRQTVHVEDALADRAYREDADRKVAVQLGGLRTLLAVPMLKENVLVGAITIFRQEVRPFTDKQIALVTNFAAQAVIAIENARLLSELHQRTTDLGEALEQQIATADVLRVISSSPGDLEPVFQAMLEKAVSICDAKFGTLFRFDGSAFHLAARVNTPAALAEFQKKRGPFLPPSGSNLDRMMKTKQVQHSADDAAEPVPAQGLRLGGARSIVHVPMLQGEQLVGALAIYRQEVRPFTEKQIELLKNFAAQAVIAIENARLLNELRERTQEVVKLNQQLEQRVADQVGEIERMGRLRRFLPPQVADLIVASGTEKQLESHRREITALFCDLRGFTGFSESSDPEDVLALLRDYHAAIGQIIVKYGGTLERFAGDGVMVIFNDPVPVENPALQAVLMALDMRAAIGAMIGKWRDLGHDLGFGIGIAHGFATLGTIGFEGRFDYAAIGTVSNVASRLCDEAKPGQILISPRVRQAVDEAVTVETVGEFTLKGIRRPMMAYNVLEPSPAKPN
jgi:GAF domain-containing protein